MHKKVSKLLIKFDCTIAQTAPHYFQGTFEAMMLLATSLQLEPD